MISVSNVVKARAAGKAARATTKSQLEESIKYVLQKGDKIKRINVNTAAQNAKVLSDTSVRQGTGTMLDFPIGILTRNKRPQYKNVLRTYHDKLITKDRELGEKLVSKNKHFKKLFTAQDMIPQGKAVTDTGKSLDAFVPTEVARASAPIDKLKPLAVPMLAFMGLDSLYEGSKSAESEEKEGDLTVKNAAELRRVLIEKIADTFVDLQDADRQTFIPSNVSEKICTLVEKTAEASEMLKQASEKIASLEGNIDHLTESNKHLKLQIIAKERSDRATKLARDMFRRGMIKQAEIGEQTDYIMDLNDDNYNILLKTVENVPVKQAGDIQKGLNKVSYIVEADNDDNIRPTLGDAIIAFADKI